MTSQLKNFFDEKKRIDDQYFKDVIALYDEAFKKNIVLGKNFLDSQKSTFFRDKIRRKVPFGIRKLVKDCLMFLKKVILFVFADF